MLLAAIFLATALADPAGAPAGPERTAATVQGKAVIAGKSFVLHHAWIIRGPDHWEKGRLNTYIVMAADDIAAELQKCPDVKCAIWDVLKNGLIMTSEGEGAFWVRAVHPQLAKEQQLSARGWTTTVDQPDHIVGRLHWEPQGKDPVILDLEIDAALLKSYPLPAAPTPQRTESSRAGWLTYGDPQRRFRFSYPPAFGEAGRGSNDGFEDRVAAIRFSQFSGGVQEGQFVLGGEAALTKGFVVLDMQAAGGLYDSTMLAVFPAPLRDSILSNLPQLTASNLCRELALEQHIDVDKSPLAVLTPQQKDAFVRLDRARNGNPRVLQCTVAGDTVTFLKEVTTQFGQARSRQQIYGAVRFLKPPFSSFQLIRASGDAPSPETLRTMTSVVESFEPQ